MRRESLDSLKISFLAKALTSLFSTGREGQPCRARCSAALDPAATWRLLLAYPQRLAAQPLGGYFSKCLAAFRPKVSTRQFVGSRGAVCGAGTIGHAARRSRRGTSLGSPRSSASCAACA